MAEDTIVHRDKDLSYLEAEVFDEDRNADEEIYGNETSEEEDFEDYEDEDIDDLDIEYIDESEIEDLDDFEYEEPSK